MSIEFVVKQSGPTLAGIKAGNLFSVDCHDPCECKKIISDLNRQLSPKGVMVIPVRFWDGKVQVYVYRKKLLEAELGKGEAKEILEEKGYRLKGVCSLVSQLVKRLKEGESFPHEVGLFLSYPPRDVRCFLNKEENHCKGKSLWRAYGDEKKAVETSLRYKKSMDECLEMFRNGVPLGIIAK